VFLTSALVIGEWSVSRFGRFAPGTRWIGGSVGLRASLRKIPYPYGESNLGRPARGLVAVLSGISGYMNWTENHIKPNLFIYLFIYLIFVISVAISEVCTVIKQSHLYGPMCPTDLYTRLGPCSY